MTEYTIGGDNSIPIAFGATGVDEVLQNVRMILTTPIFTVALDREFGLDWSLLDKPMPMAQALLTEQIFTQIRRYEPRADVLEISFLQGTAEALDGHMIPQVRLAVMLDGAA